MKYRRALVWSRGLRKLIGLGEELTDEELAAQTFAEEKDYVLTIWDWASKVTRPESEHIASDLLILCNMTHADRKELTLYLRVHDIKYSFGLPDDCSMKIVKHHYKN